MIIVGEKATVVKRRASPKAHLDLGMPVVVEELVSTAGATVVVVDTATVEELAA